MNSGSFKNYLQTIRLQIKVYQEDLILNNLQWMICNKTQPNQITYLVYMYKEE